MSPYVILGIPEGSSHEVVKSAYRKLVKQYHPDVNPNDEAMTVRFHEVQRAYEQIMSPPVHSSHSRFSFTTILETYVEISVEDAFHGTKTAVPLRSPQGRVIEIMVDIPPHTLNGTRLRVNGLPQEFQAVELYINVRLSEQGELRVMGTTILKRVQVDFVTAILGGEVAVETLDGPRYFTVASGSQNGTMVKLSDLGFLIPNAPKGTRDNFIVVLEIVMPTSITAEQRSSLERYRALS